MNSIRNMLLLALVFLSACFGTNKSEKLLTDSDWQVEKVINLKPGLDTEPGEEQKKLWHFEHNHSYLYNTENKGRANQVDGKWELDGNSLFIANEFDSIEVTIEKITTDEMVWLIAEKDSMKIYLSAKIKTVNVPNFPAQNNP